MQITILTLHALNLPVNICLSTSIEWKLSKSKINRSNNNNNNTNYNKMSPSASDTRCSIICWVRMYFALLFFLPLVKLIINHTECVYERVKWYINHKLIVEDTKSKLALHLNQFIISQRATSFLLNLSLLVN